MDGLNAGTELDLTNVLVGSTIFILDCAATKKLFTWGYRSL
jgi:hypothetical protein